MNNLIHFPTSIQIAILNAVREAPVNVTVEFGHGASGYPYADIGHWDRAELGASTWEDFTITFAGGSASDNARFTISDVARGEDVGTYSDEDALGTALATALAIFHAHQRLSSEGGVREAESPAMSD